jgi:threonine dehydrogenase-like Zn-dependent dehydrogenase
LDDDKLETARAAGASETIHTGREKLHKRLDEITNGRGPDVVIEAIGSAETFHTAVQVAAFAGRVVYIGYVKDLVSYETRLFVQKEIDILGSRNALPEDFREVMQMLEEHRFPVDAAVSSIVTLEEAPQALHAWSENPSSIRKIMVRFD